MKYFILQHSLNQKVIGKHDPIKEVVHNCHVWDNPKFIDRLPFKKIESIPILSNAFLYAKAKQTDLIEVGSIGFSHGSAIISNDLKKTIEKFNYFGIQFFSTFILHKNQKITNYWQTHIYDVPYDYIDFKNTDLLLKDRGENNKPIQNLLERTNKNDFLNIVNTNKYPKMIFLKNVVFKKKMNLDFFYLRYFEGNGYGIVSEKLKNEIEKQKLTGIEFRPFELTLQEWYHSGVREKVYGAI